MYMINLKSNIIKQIVFFIIIISFCKCNAPTAKKEDKFGGGLIYGSSTVPTSIHPILTTDSISAHLVPLIFKGLMKITADGGVVPDLAELYEISTNGLVFKITLKKGVKFHDGKELTSKDVKFTFENMKKIDEEKKINIYSQMVVFIKNIEVIDKYNIKITLNQTFVPFLYYLSVGILPEHIYKGKDDKKDKVYWYPVGTGPFKIASINNKKIILNRFDDYFAGKAYLDKIICETDSEDTRIWAKLLRGEIDYSRHISLSLYNEVRRVGFLKTYNMFEPAFYMLFLNCKNSLFQDKRVRLALNYAIDREAIIKEALKGRGQVCYSPILPNHWTFNKNLKPYEYNPQKALKLLEEAGWINEKGRLHKNGEPFIFECVLLKKFPNVLEPSMLIQRQLNAIGIKMEIKHVEDINKFYAQLNNNYVTAFFSRMGSSVEPDHNYHFFHSSRIGTTNVLGYKNPEVDRLLDLGRKIWDKEKRKEVYCKFQEVVYDDPPGIFTYYKYSSIVMNKRVRDAFPDDFEAFGDVEKWWIEKDKKYIKK